MPFARHRLRKGAHGVRAVGVRIRSFISWAVGAVVTGLVVPFLQTPAAKLAEHLGFDKVLEDHWGALISTLSSFATGLTGSPWYVLITGLACGAALTLWADVRFKTRRPNPEVKSNVQDKVRYVREEVSIKSS